MIETTWKEILSSALRESGLNYRVFSADCAQDSSACFATLEDSTTGSLKEITVNRDFHPTTDSLKIAVVRAIAPVNRCERCGETTATYERISTNAAFVHEEGAHPDTIPDAYAWACSSCGYERRST